MDTARETVNPTVERLHFHGRRYLAPPFNGWSIYRNPTPNGFWSTVNFGANDGKLQIQIGRQGTGNSTLRIGYQFAAWQTDVSITRPKFYTAVLRPEIAVVRPNGGVVTHWAYMELGKATQSPTSTAQRVYPGQSVPLAIGPNDGLGTYRLRVGIYTRIVYKGTAAPYGELIARATPVYEHTVGFDPEQSAELDEGLDLEELAQALRDADDDGLVRELGDESDVTASGLRSFDAN